MSRLQLQRVCREVLHQILRAYSYAYRPLDANIPLNLSQAVLSATQAPKAPPLTQSAAMLVGNTSEKTPTSNKVVDTLLDGGLKRGSVLEISGPPGTEKETAAMNIAKNFLKNKRGVLFVGASDSYNLVNFD